MSADQQPVRVGSPEAAELLMREYEHRGQIEQRVMSAAAAPSAFPFTAENWPLCPLAGCGRPLQIADQNEVGDYAWECIAGPLGVAHDYQAVYRVGSQRYEPRPMYAAGLERIPTEQVIAMTHWVEPLLPAPKPAERLLPMPRPDLPPTLAEDRPVALTPSGIAAMFKAGSTVGEIAQRFGITAQEVEASIRVAALMEQPPAPPAAAPAPRRRRPRQQPEPPTA